MDYQAAYCEQRARADVLDGQVEYLLAKIVGLTDRYQKLVLANEVLRTSVARMSDEIDRLYPWAERKGDELGVHANAYEAWCKMLQNQSKALELQEHVSKRKAALAQVQARQAEAEAQAQKKRVELLDGMADQPVLPAIEGLEEPDGDTCGVYLMRYSTTPTYKIGYSSDANKRLLSLQTGLPEPLHLIAVISAHDRDDRLSIESHWHTHFHEHRVATKSGSEWFDLPVDCVSQFVHAAVKSGGFVGYT